MSEGTSEQRQGREVLLEQSSIDVLYIAPTTKPDSLPSDFHEECVVNFDVVTSFPQALSQNGDPAFDCVVIETTGTGTSESIVTKCSAQYPDLTVIMYGHPQDSPETYRDYIEDGIVEYVPREADTDDQLLLARQIERCVEFECKRTAARNLRVAVDQMDHYVFVADRDGQIEYVNRAFEKVGIPPEDLEGQLISTLRPENHGRPTTEDFSETVAEAPWSGELTIETPVGERTFDLTTTQIGGNSDLQRIVAVGDDITERKQREKRLRSFQKAVEQAGHVIMITDTDGKMEYVNPAFEEVTGYNSEEALGEKPNLLNSGEQDEHFYQELWETIRSGEVWEGELVNQRKTGERYHIRQTISPVTDNRGEIERYVAVNTDITEQKQHERQIERERNRLEEFAQTVAHDLRNPLTIALGNVELVHDKLNIHEEALECAINALRRMEALIDEVLTLSKQGQTIHEPEPVDPTQIIRQAWENVETARATLTIDQEIEGWSLEADESRLCELLENLFRNAIEHGTTSSPSQEQADTEPDITVRVGRLERAQGFFVADDGPGIQPSNRNRIFEGGFTTADDGTGFGLAIVAQIAEAHGWELDVTESRTGGARFEIRTDIQGRQSNKGGES